MRKFNTLLIIYLCLSWIVSFSSSLAMEVVVEKDNKTVDVPTTPYVSFSLAKYPLPIEVQKKYSINLRNQLIEIIRLSNGTVKLNSKEISDCLESFRNCFLICNEWGHPAREMFNEMIHFMESKNSSSNKKRKKAAKTCIKKFMQTPNTNDQIDATEMKLMFFTKDSESKAKHYKKHSSDHAHLTAVTQLVEILNAANKCEITGYYLQGMCTEKLFGIDDLYFDEEGVKPNPLQINK